MTVHFIAIGGSVMHQLAIALAKKGYRVTGSDDEIFDPARSNLQTAGILPPAFGWFPEKIHSGLDAVILGMHARKDNPELKEAKALLLKIYSFPEYIYQESLNKTRIVIGGSHGKTTTTSMIMHVLRSVGKSFDYLVGARLEGFAQSVSITDAPLIVCEGDEYPASPVEKRPKFHFLYPHIAVITGIAWDHINVFPDFATYLLQFKIFLDKIESNGVLIYNAADAAVKQLVEGHEGQFRRIGYSIPEHLIEEESTRVLLEGSEARLHVFGNHNLLNLNAAYLVCSQVGIQTKDFLEALETFKGASRRLELLGASGTLRIYRDFAHAPSKVKATMEAVRQQFPLKRLVACLELHTYSSLNLTFISEYRGALREADDAAVYYSRHALELKQLPALPKEKVYEAFDKKELVVLNEVDELRNWLNHQDYSDTVLVLMSSGNYDGLDIATFANELIERSGPSPEPGK